MDCTICINENEELFTCPVLNYNESICYDCISKLIKIDTIQCPFCRNSINYNELFYNVVFEFEYSPMEYDNEDDDQCLKTMVIKKDELNETINRLKMIYYTTIIMYQ